MSSKGAPRLTDKQRAVMAQVDRRVPIKVIAAEMGVSESRINQHIRALKDAYGVDTLNDLVEANRAPQGASAPVDTPAQAPAEPPAEPFRKPAYIKNHLPDPPPLAEKQGRAPGEFVFADAVHIPIDAPWHVNADPRIVPGALDGDHAVLYRLVAMVGLSVGIVAAVVLVVAAALSVSEVLGGMVHVPAETSRPA